MSKTGKYFCVIYSFRPEGGKPQTAFDILMFLANNPRYKTASDIVEVRKIKANLVSVNVDKLVQEGYLERQAVEGDRRKTRLICTDKVQPKTLNRVTGIVLVILGAAVFLFSALA